MKQMFFLEVYCFFYDPADVGDLISGSSVWLPTDDGLIECGPPIQNNATRILLVRYSTPRDLPDPGIEPAFPALAGILSNVLH